MLQSRKTERGNYIRVLRGDEFGGGEGKREEPERNEKRVAYVHGALILQS